MKTKFSFLFMLLVSMMYSISSFAIEVKVGEI